MMEARDGLALKLSLGKWVGILGRGKLRRGEMGFHFLLGKMEGVSRG